MQYVSWLAGNDKCHSCQLDQANPSIDIAGDVPPLEGNLERIIQCLLVV